MSNSVMKTPIVGRSVLALDIALLGARPALTSCGTAGIANSSARLRETGNPHVANIATESRTRDELIRV